MKRFIKVFSSIAILLYMTSGFSQNGVPYPNDKDLPEVIIYSSGKIESFKIVAKNRKKAGEEPTAKFEVIYHNFTDDAKAAFAKAVENWSYLIHSPVTIKIDATWQPLDPGVLGSAGANSFRRDFKNAPQKLTWYPIAIANKLAGYDLEPENFDIRARFSSSFDWYLGLDGNCPANKYDFISTVMHEIGHGLGFLGSANVDGSNGDWGSGTKFPMIYDRFVYNGGDELLIDTLIYSNPSPELKTQYTSGNVFFHSELSDAAAPDAHAVLYSPSSWNDGSSYSHLGEIYNGTGNAMMTYSAGYGEVTHHPGDITLGMFAEMGWISVLFKHQKLKDIESMGAPVFVETELFSDSSIVAGSVELHYSIDDFVTDNVIQMSTSNDTLYSASIPVLVTDTVKYYFEATTSLNRTYYYPVQGTLPVNSIDSTLFFAIGADNIAPNVEHVPVASIFNFEENLNFNILADDNQSIESVTVRYNINEGSPNDVLCNLIEYSEIDGSYIYQTSIDVSNYNDRDTLYYQVIAKDVASTSNEKVLPETGFFKVVILDINAPTEDLTITFDEPGDKDMFYENGLTIMQPEADFTSKGLHSPHPYEEGQDFLAGEIDYIAMLKTPILVKDEDAFMRFDEIVIVEPGTTGAYFGHDEFWDYVIVEGSVDSAKTWFEFEDGYDCRIENAFTTAYNDEADGTEGMYVSHMINLRGNANLLNGNPVLIRFRLWSDQASKGWGWALDNLEIQGEVTTINPTFVDTESARVFPSPSEGCFNIELKSKSIVNNYEIILYNINGKIVYDKKGTLNTNTLSHSVDITDQPAGVYFVKIDLANQVITKKVVRK